MRIHDPRTNGRGIFFFTRTGNSETIEPPARGSRPIVLRRLRFGLKAGDCRTENDTKRPAVRASTYSAARYDALRGVVPQPMNAAGEIERLRAALACGPTRGRRFHPEIDEAAERFGARRLVGLSRGPGVDRSNGGQGNPKCELRIMSCGGTPSLLPGKSFLS
jgi:hypothetical protein